MNWRILVGLVFLLAGMIKLYALIAGNANGNLSGSPVYAEIGCCVWIGVGIYLVIKGIKSKGL